MARVDDLVEQVRGLGAFLALHAVKPEFVRVLAAAVLEVRWSS
jgi:hypothetical protein